MMYILIKVFLGQSPIWIGGINNLENISVFDLDSSNELKQEFKEWKNSIENSQIFNSNDNEILTSEMERIQLEGFSLANRLSKEMLGKAIVLYSFKFETHNPSAPFLKTKLAFKLMPDYYSFPIWRYGEEIDKSLNPNVNPSELPISDGLKNALLEWSNVYDKTLDIDNPINTGFENLNSLEDFKLKGFLLAKNLQEELGENYEIIYFMAGMGIKD